MLVCCYEADSKITHRLLTCVCLVLWVLACPSLAVRLLAEAMLRACDASCSLPIRLTAVALLQECQSRAQIDPVASQLAEIAAAYKQAFGVLSCTRHPHMPHARLCACLAAV
jgi:hypothetical protein